jgi:CBS domain-containing protein
MLVTEALRQMGTSQEEHLVVLDQGRLAGILTRTDVDRIVKILAVEQGAEAPDATA